MMRYIPIIALFLAANVSADLTMTLEAAKAYEERMQALYTEANETVGHRLQCSMYLRITATDPDTRGERFKRGFIMERQVRLELEEMGFEPNEADMFVYYSFQGTKKFLHRMDVNTACP